MKQSGPWSGLGIHAAAAAAAAVAAAAADDNDDDGDAGNNNIRRQKLASGNNEWRLYTGINSHGVEYSLPYWDLT